MKFVIRRDSFDKSPKVLYNLYLAICLIKFIPHFPYYKRKEPNLLSPMEFNDSRESAGLFFYATKSIQTSRQNHNPRCAGE